MCVVLSMLALLWASHVWLCDVMCTSLYKSALFVRAALVRILDILILLCDGVECIEKRRAYAGSMCYARVLCGVCFVYGRESVSLHRVDKSHHSTQTSRSYQLYSASRTDLLANSAHSRPSSLPHRTRERRRHTHRQEAADRHTRPHEHRVLPLERRPRLIIRHRGEGDRRVQRRLPRLA